MRAQYRCWLFTDNMNGTSPPSSTSLTATTYKVILSLLSQHLKHSLPLFRHPTPLFGATPEPNNRRKRAPQGTKAIMIHACHAICLRPFFLLVLHPPFAMPNHDNDQSRKFHLFSLQVTSWIRPEYFINPAGHAQGLIDIIQIVIASQEVTSNAQVSLSSHLSSGSVV